MPKLKTNRGAAKRFRRTANGYKHRRAYKNHILTKKGPKRKRQLRGLGLEQPRLDIQQLFGLDRDDLGGVLEGVLEDREPERDGRTLEEERPNFGE